MAILAVRPRGGSMLRHTRTKITAITVFLLVGANCIAIPVFAQANGKAKSLRGYSEASATAENDWENKMHAVPKPELLREYMNQLAGHPHNVGSPRDHENADFIRDKFQSWGFDAKIEEFDVLYP